MEESPRVVQQQMQPPQPQEQQPQQPQQHGLPQQPQDADQPRQEPLAAGDSSVDPVQATIKHCSRAVSILTIIAHSACVVLMIVAFGLNQVASVQSDTWGFDRDYFSGRSCARGQRYSGMIFQFLALATCIAGIVVASIETGTHRYLWNRHLSLCIMACAWVFLLVASICLGVVKNVSCSGDYNHHTLGSSTIIVIFTTCFLFVCVVARLTPAICRQRAMQAHHIVTSQHQSAPDGITSASAPPLAAGDGSVDPVQATLKHCSRVVSILTIIAHSACVVILIVAFGLNQVASVQTGFWGFDRGYFSAYACAKAQRYSGMIFQFFALATCIAGIVVASIETGTRRYLWKRHLSLCIMACACVFLLVASICLGIVKNVHCYHHHFSMGNSTIIVIFTTCFLFVCVVARLIAAICFQRARRAHLMQAERRPASPTSSTSDVPRQEQEQQASTQRPVRRKEVFLVASNLGLTDAAIAQLQPVAARHAAEEFARVQATNDPPHQCPSPTTTSAAAAAVNAASASAMKQQPHPPPQQLACDICFIPFDSNEHKPCLCVHCGNTVCLTCIKEVRQTCPFCRADVGTKIVTNVAVLQALEGR